MQLAHYDRAPDEGACDSCGGTDEAERAMRSQSHTSSDDLSDNVASCATAAPAASNGGPGMQSNSCDSTLTEGSRDSCDGTIENYIEDSYLSQASFEDSHQSHAKYDVSPQRIQSQAGFEDALYSDHGVDAADSDRGSCGGTFENKSDLITHRHNQLYSDLIQTLCNPSSIGECTKWHAPFLQSTEGKYEHIRVDHLFDWAFHEDPDLCPPPDVPSDDDSDSESWISDPQFGFSQATPYSCTAPSMYR